MYGAADRSRNPPLTLRMGVLCALPGERAAFALHLLPAMSYEPPVDPIASRAEPFDSPAVARVRSHWRVNIAAHCAAVHEFSHSTHSAQFYAPIAAILTLRSPLIFSSVAKRLHSTVLVYSYLLVHAIRQLYSNLTTCDCIHMSSVWMTQFAILTHYYSM